LKVRSTWASRLTELSLCKNLKIEPHPIREALIRLEAEGLIERIQGGGFKAQSFSLEEIEEATELRAELECFAIRLACRRGFSDLKLVEMEHLAEVIKKAERGGIPHVESHRPRISSAPDRVGEQLAAGRGDPWRASCSSHMAQSQP